MGCLELRTVRKHLNRLHKSAASACLQLSEQLSHTPQYARLPEPQPGQCAVMRLSAIHARIILAAGASAQRDVPLRQFVQEHWWRFAGNQSMSRVSRIDRPP